jgi:starvation-inducible outer membrane lipoprotein
VKGKVMRIFLILLMAMFMVGCMTTPAKMRYSHPTATYDQFTDASYQCVKNVGKVIGAKSNVYGEVIPEQVEVDCEKFSACMGKLGFTLSSDGEFRVPKDMELKCN